jgi:TonB family protein
MSKRRIVVTLAGIAVLTLLAGLASIRAFPLKASGAPPTAANADPATTRVFKVGEKGVTAPVPIYNPDPAYTKEAKDAKLNGNVILEIVVAPDGTVSDVKAKRGLGMGLTESAVSAVKTWKFKPAMKAEKLVACWLMVEITFKIF